MCYRQMYVLQRCALEVLCSMVERERGKSQKRERERDRVRKNAPTFHLSLGFTTWDRVTALRVSAACHLIGPLGQQQCGDQRDPLSVLLYDSLSLHCEQREQGRVPSRGLLGARMVDGWVWVRVYVFVCTCGCVSVCVCV